MTPPRIILGICDSITSGAAVSIDGRIVAAVNEERLCRTKMAMGWPRLSIAEVMRIAGVTANDIDAAAVATNYLYWRPDARSIDGYFDTDWGARKNLVIRLGSVGSQIAGDYSLARRTYYALKRLLTRKRRRLIAETLRDEHAVHAPIQFIDHHQAHAAAAYYTGGEPNAVVATLDGAGDFLSATISHGEKGQLTKIHEVDSYDSVGNFYSYITHILGFKAHQHEGKVTGLAAHGEPLYLDGLLKLVNFHDGSIHNSARAFHTAAIEKLRRLIPSDARREDVAASVQELLEVVCVAYVRHWVQQLNVSHLSLAGGVVANVKLNQRLLAIPEVDSIFVHPGMGDDGLAVGAALQASADSTPPDRREALVHRVSDVYWGPSFSDAAIESALNDAGIQAQRLTDAATTVADLLVNGKVVARFDGRMEYGPRALGNRSILVHAGDATVNEWLNKRLNRTEFMPFAPVTLSEEADACYTDLQGAEYSAQFMTVTTGCTESLRRNCPAVVHVDRTARPQLVGLEENPGYRAILEAYQRRTGYSTIINTSFNIHEEPIVCTPDDAIRAFQRGHLDYLLIGNFLAQSQPGADPTPSSTSRQSLAG